MNIFKLFVYEPKKQMAIDIKETLSNGCLILYFLNRLKQTALKIIIYSYTCTTKI